MQFANTSPHIYAITNKKPTIQMKKEEPEKRVYVSSFYVRKVADEIGVQIENDKVGDFYRIVFELEIRADQSFSWHSN